MKKSRLIFTLTIALFAVIIALTTAAIIFAIPLFTQDVAYADGEAQYIMAPTRDLSANPSAGVSTIALLGSDGETVVFYIPESYYLTYINVAFNDYYLVSYADKQYYVRKEGLNVASVNFSDGTSPYPDIRLELAENASVSIENTVITAADGYTVRFLGYNQDGTQYYVSATKDGRTVYGMTDTSAFTTSSIPYHAISEAQRQALINDTPITDGGNIAPNTSIALRVMLIIGIAVPAVIIIILLFKPSKNDAGYGKKVIRRGTRNDEYDYDRSKNYSRGRDRDDDYDDTSRRRGNSFRDDRYDYDNRYNRRSDYERGRRYSDDYDDRDDRRRGYDRRDDYDDRLR